MQLQNVNVLTKSLKFKQLDVKLRNSQNLNKFLIFFVKSQRRKHCDNEIIYIIFNWKAESINSGDFLVRMMRKLFVCMSCIIWSIKNTLQRSGALFKEWKHWLKSCLWAVLEMLKAVLEQNYSSCMSRATSELNMNISVQDFSNRSELGWKVILNSRWSIKIF